jgi:hypothetical protein
MAGWRSTNWKGRLRPLGKKNLPKPIAGAEWQIDSGFNAADEILHDPSEAVFKVAIANGFKVVTWR